jgi:hypothetical protein
MTCTCDDRTFPPALKIGAGLDDLPRQLATFGEWREALLDSVGLESLLHGWRARDNDMGLLYLELAAYVLDLGAFYHKAHSQEGLLRTSRLPTSTRRLVGLLGYRPRPAVAAFADLGLAIDGARIVTLPTGTAFRSEGVDDVPPQVFELEAPAVVHPLRNRWPLAPVVPTLFGTAGGGTQTLGSLLFRPGTVAVRPGTALLVRVGATHMVRFLASDTEYRGLDKETYRRLTFNSSIAIPAGTPTSDVAVSVASSTASLWARSTLSTALSGNEVLLDSLHPDIAVGSQVTLRRGSDVRWFTVTGATVAAPTLVNPIISYLKDKDGNDAGSLTSAAITGMATRLTLDVAVNNRKPPGGQDWTNAMAAELSLAHGFRPAGQLVQEAKSSAVASDPFRLAGRPRTPLAAANRLMIEDVDGRGATVTGAVDFATGAVTLDPGVAWPERPLTPPLNLGGNVVQVSRGESVMGEALGRGDATQSRLRLKLQKKPLTYLPGPSPGNDWGITSTLKVWVDGVRWSEVPSFFHQPTHAEVFCVEHDDEENAYVVFGGGARPSTGASIVADYRFGAGAKRPPPGGIRQLAKPVPAISSVRNPVGAYGGADREPQDQLRKLAPRSALLLGRAISVLDFEAAAASTPGVRAVRAEWRWNTSRQEPVVEVAFIGPPALAPVVRDQLKSLAEPSAPLEAIAATAVPKSLSLQLTIDPRYSAAQVIKAARAVLIGTPEALLSPESLGVARPLYRSVIFEAMQAVPGVVSVADLRLDGIVMTTFGVLPGPASYFDFEAGSVVINGDDGHV